jgi:hypothetical protein
VTAAGESGGEAGRRSRRWRRTRARLRAGELVYLVAAIALFVLMFVTWFGSEVSGQAEGVPFGGGGSGGNAWQTLEVIPLFLMLAIVVGVGAALMKLAGSDWKPAIPANAAVTLLGGLATVLILIRIIFPPGLGELGGIAVEATLKVGVFLALAAALGIAYGGYRAMREAGDSFRGIAQRLESERPKPRARPKSKDDAKPKRRFGRSASRRQSPSSSD